MSTIKILFQGNKIVVPDYQRGYSWGTELNPHKEPKQVNVFLSDLEKFINCINDTDYYLGHFLFEKTKENSYDVIDGQQRLTTLLILLSAIFARLREINSFTETQFEIYECIIKNNSNYHFETINNDKQLFRDYVIDQITDNVSYTEVKTVSGKRIMIAFDFFKEKLLSKDESYLTKMLNTLQNASYTIKYIETRDESIQAFSFSNRFSK